MTVDTARWERLEQVARKHKCACGGLLSVALIQGQLELRCGACRTISPKFVKEMSLTERYLAGEVLDIATINQIEKRLEKENRMSPIKGLSETYRLPRLGKLHLGIKKIAKSGAEYPAATDYFVFPAEFADIVKKVYGTTQPKSLAILFPVEEEDTFASQYYRAYSRSRGLICRGDGETATAVVDTVSGEIAWDKPDAKPVHKDVPCRGRDCPFYQQKRCHEQMCLQFMLPDFPGLGVWQVDTRSINSILNINSNLAMVRAVAGHVQFVPLLLTLEPKAIVNPDDGKKKTVMVLNLRVGGTIGQFLEQTKDQAKRFAMPKPEVPQLEQATGGPAIETEEADDMEGCAEADTPPEAAKEEVVKATDVAPQPPPDLEPDALAEAFPRTAELPEVAAPEIAERWKKLSGQAADLKIAEAKFCQFVSGQLPPGQFVKAFSDICPPGMTTGILGNIEKAIKAHIERKP